MARISVKQVVCNCVMLVIMAVIILSLHKFGKPYKRGFYCNDESLRYPYKPSTVSRKSLFIMAGFLPMLFILLTEIFRTLDWEKTRTFKPGQKLYQLVVRLCVFIGHFVIGMFFNMLLRDIAKYGVGRQRPHFIEACKPNVGYQNYTFPNQYITDFHCTGTDPRLVDKSQLSFYSGHAAFSFYAAWYISLYLQARLYRRLASRIVLPMIQGFLFGGAAFIAYTRVQDCHHHQLDVLIGATIGSITGIINAIMIANVFERNCESCHKDVISEEDEVKKHN